MVQEIIQQHPTLPIMCNAETGEVCRTTGKTAWKWTKGYLHPKGYYRFRVGSKIPWVHRLIAETFLDNPDHKPTVDHINRNRMDNRLCNLRFATMDEQTYNRSNANPNKYGVRRKDNPKEYFKAYDRAHREERNQWRRNRNLMKKLEKFCNW